MSKKRVLHIAGGRGGAFLAAQNLVSATNSYSNEFEAEIMTYHQGPIQRLVSKSLTLVQSVTSADLYEFHSAKSLAAIKIADVARYSPDLVHIHNWYNLLDLDLIDQIMNEYPTLFTLHDERLLTGGCHMTFGCSNYLGACSACPAERIIYGQTAKSKMKLNHVLGNHSPVHVIAPSQWLFDKVRESTSIGVDFSVYKVRNLVDPVFTLSQNKRVNRDSNQELKIVFIAANLNSNVKNLTCLFDALAEFLSIQKILRIELTLIGGGKVKEFNLPSNLKLIHKASMSPSKILKEFENQDLCIVPSLSENRPNVIVEAMLAGTLVIASNVGGIPELVQDGFTGFTCTPDKKGIVEALLRYLASSKAKKAEIISVAQNRATQDHHPMMIVEEHASIYRRLQKSWSS